jgi:alpha-tubulin suppressor-like RCC1 family protein
MQFRHITSCRAVFLAASILTGCSSFSATINKVEADAGGTTGGSTYASSTTSTGGVIASGGSSPQGGNSTSESAGGGSVVGGTAASAGMSSSGGASTQGGNSTGSTAAAAAGGTASTGGATAVGGATSTGYASPTSGGTGPLGTVATGGSITAGGATSVGGSRSQEPIAVSVTSGNAHTCVLLSDSTVRCWGSNTNGQLGNNTTTDSPVPVRVVNMPPSANVKVTAIKGLEYGTCAVLSDKSLQCWGSNSAGQLGDGTTSDRSVPTSVLGLPSSVVGAAGGSGYSCALLNNGHVMCWGSNSNGALGDGTTIDSLAPKEVYNLDNALGIAASGSTTCVLLNTGNIKCWGAGNRGQLGNGGQDPSQVPVSVSNIPTASNGYATQISVSYHSCAVLSDKSIECWGANQHGELGDGTTKDSPTPVPVVGASSAIAVVVRGYTTCALLNDATVKCWGGNDYGQLGIDSIVSRMQPVNVLDPSGSGVLSNIASLSAGISSVCALSTSGEVYCWGQNVLGQLGNGTTTDSLLPVLVSGF